MQYPAGDRKVNREKKYKQYSNSLHSATACNHVLKWKLHLGQVHGYFMDYFCHWLYTTHVVGQLLHDGIAVNDNCMEIPWCLSTVCIFECMPVLGFVQTLCVLVWAQSVTCERDKSGTLDAICMISCYCTTALSTGLELQLYREKQMTSLIFLTPQKKKIWTAWLVFL